MSRKMIKLAGAVLFLIVLNVGLFSMAAIKLASFWISWIFMHIAFVIFVCIFVFSVPEQRKLKFAYSETAVAAYYFIIEMAAGFVLMGSFACNTDGASGGLPRCFLYTEENKPEHRSQGGRGEGGFASVSDDSGSNEGCTEPGGLRCAV